MRRFAIFPADWLSDRGLIRRPYILVATEHPQALQAAREHANHIKAAVAVMELKDLEVFAPDPGAPPSRRKIAPPK
jgi:hypothetical protein